MTKKKILTALAGLTLAAIFFMGNPMEVMAETTGTVTVDSARVRTDANSNAEPVATASSGAIVTVLDNKTDEKGNVWYHVTLSDGTEGYIRSDLMTVNEEVSDGEAVVDEVLADDGIAVDDIASPEIYTAGVNLGSVVIPEGVETADYQLATVKVGLGKVRSDASTDVDVVEPLDQGAEIVIAGTKAGADANTWYYIAFVKNGSQKTGYIRSDLITLGEMIPTQSTEIEYEIVEEPTEEVPQEPSVNNDYELVYTDDGTGNEVWYLYNHIDNTRQKLQELLDFAANQQNVSQSHKAELKNYKIIIIALGALLAVAIVVIVILIVRNVHGDYDYYEDDEDEEEEEDEVEEYVEAPRSRRSRRRRDYEEEEEEEEEPVYEAPAPAERRMQNAAKRRAAEGNAPRKPVSYDSDDDASAVAPQRKPERKTKNFIFDDEDFEFEFLNMDDK